MRSLKIPVVLTREEVERLISLAEKDIETSKTAHQKFNAVRNLAILRLFWSTGLRVSELCNLNLDCMFSGEHQIKVRKGKFGNEDYQLVRRKETWQAIEGYLVLRENIAGKGPAFFISYFGLRILPRQINRYLKDYGKRAGIKKNLHPHTLRHSFATEYFRKTKDLYRTKEILRHKSISSTEVYLHTTKERLAEGLLEAGL